MTMNINDFKAQLVGGGARPNLFRVVMPFPAFAGVGGETSKLTFMCKAASLPASQVGTIEIPYRGRKVKIAGDRTFEQYSITVINDTDFLLRNAFERWSNQINQHERNEGLQNPIDYQVDIILEQLNRNDEVIKIYKLVGAFPVNVGAIELSSESTDAIEEFQVQLEYQYWQATTTS